MEEQELDPAQEEEGVHQEEERGHLEEGHLDEEVVAVVEAGEGAISKEEKVEEEGEEEVSEEVQVVVVVQEAEEGAGGEISTIMEVEEGGISPSCVSKKFRGQHMSFHQWTHQRDNSLADPGFTSGTSTLG